MAYKLHKDLSGDELHIAKLHADTHKKTGTDLINIDELGRIVAPVSGDDGKVLYWNNATQRFEYKIVLAGLYFVGVSEGVSSTTSTTYQEKLKLNFNIVHAGDYRIDWQCAVAIDVKSRNVIFRTQINDTITIVENEWGTPDDSLVGKYQTFSGFIVNNFTASNHFVDIDFRAVLTTGQVNIRSARLLVSRL